MSFAGVKVDIRDTPILHGVSGYAAQGQVLAILGPSGKLTASSESHRGVRASVTYWLFPT